jgi:hypothetical protein
MSDSFDAFNFVKDDGPDLEMALAETLRQESNQPLGATLEEPDCLFTVEITNESASDADQGSKPRSDPGNVPPAAVLEIEAAPMLTLPSVTRIFHSLAHRQSPLEIFSIPRHARLESNRWLQRGTQNLGAMPCIVRAGHDPTPAPLDFRLGTNDAIDRVAHVVSRHEGRPDSINWNDNGAGISAGMFQANQKLGELPELLHRMEKANPQLFAHVLGVEFAEIAKNHPEKIRQVEFTNDTGKAPNKLGLQLQEALKQPSFQQVQLEMLRKKIVHAAKVASSYGIKSERGIALVADLINQLGEGGGVRTRGARYYLSFALSQKSETEKLAAIIKHDLKGFGRGARDRDILQEPNLGNGVTLR